MLRRWLPLSLVVALQAADPARADSLFGWLERKQQCANCQQPGYPKQHYTKPVIWNYFHGLNLHPQPVPEAYSSDRYPEVAPGFRVLTAPCDAVDPVTLYSGMGAFRVHRQVAVTTPPATDSKPASEPTPADLQQDSTGIKQATENKKLPMPPPPPRAIEAKKPS